MSYIKQECAGKQSAMPFSIFFIAALHWKLVKVSAACGGLDLCCPGFI